MIGNHKLLIKSHKRVSVLAGFCLGFACWNRLNVIGLELRGSGISLGVDKDISPKALSKVCNRAKIISLRGN